MEALILEHKTEQDNIILDMMSSKQPEQSNNLVDKFIRVNRKQLF